jgi:hypothetical protein
VEGQVKLRDGKKVGARRGRGAGARAGGRSRCPCPRSGRLGGWCCASRRLWQVSGRAGGGGAGGPTHGWTDGRTDPARALQRRRAGPGRAERASSARNSRRPRGAAETQPRGNRRAAAARAPDPGTLPPPWSRRWPGGTRIPCHPVLGWAEVVVPQPQGQPTPFPKGQIGVQRGYTWEPSPSSPQKAALHPAGYPNPRSYCAVPRPPFSGGAEAVCQV